MFFFFALIFLTHATVKVRQPLFLQPSFLQPSFLQPLFFATTVFCNHCFCDHCFCNHCFYNHCFSNHCLCNQSFFSKPSIVFATIHCVCNPPYCLCNHSLFMQPSIVFCTTISLFLQPFHCFCNHSLFLRPFFFSPFLRGVVLLEKNPLRYRPEVHQPLFVCLFVCLLCLFFWIKTKLLPTPNDKSHYLRRRYNSIHATRITQKKTNKHFPDDIGLIKGNNKKKEPTNGTYVKVISGVLVRLTTCKRLTNSLPKLSLTLSPPETAG